jgi:hypothetical protein
MYLYRLVLQTPISCDGSADILNFHVFEIPHVEQSVTKFVSILSDSVFCFSVHGVWLLTQDGMNLNEANGVCGGWALKG